MSNDRDTILADITRSGIVAVIRAGSADAAVAAAAALAEGGVSAVDQQEILRRARAYREALDTVAAEVGA